MPNFCWGPWGIAGCAPHMHTSCVTTCSSPHRIDRAGWKIMARMILRVRHDRFIWIITPLYLISMMRPSPVIFLRQNRPPAHSIFLPGNMQWYLIGCSMNFCEADKKQSELVQNLSRYIKITFKRL